MIYRLHFDNSVYSRKQQMTAQSDSLPVLSRVFFQAFPFNLVINRGLKLVHIGAGLHYIKLHLHLFSPARPLRAPRTEHRTLHTAMSCVNAGQDAKRRLPPAPAHHQLHVGVGALRCPPVSSLSYFTLQCVLCPH